MDPYLAQILMFAGNFNPRGWLFCNGSLLSISENTALFSLLGTTYGGDGQTTFALPDFRSRIPRGTFQGAGLSDVVLGETSGTESTTLLNANLPAHNHPITGTINLKAAGNGNLSTDPANRYLGPGSFYAAAADLQSMAPAQSTLTAGSAGSSTPLSNMPPYLGVNFIIASEGIFPSRN